MPQFDPTATLLVGPPEQTPTLIQGLRVQFQVRKTETPEPNQAMITVYNVSDTTRNRLGTTGSVAILQAGFNQDPANIKIVCEMDVVDAQSAVQPPLTSTRLICADGMNAKRAAPKAYSYTAGKGAKQILAEVVSDFGLTLRAVGSVAEDIYNNGFSEAGFFDDLMTKLTAKLNARWSVQNGEVVLSAIDQPTDFSAIKVNADTGLISIERKNTVGGPETPGQKDGWLAKCLMLPIVEPGARILLESNEVNATFRVAALTHNGDTHGQDWFTDLELEEFE